MKEHSIEEKIMEFIDKKLELILLWSLILLGTDFSNLQQYSLSKLFQLFFNGN